MKCKKWYVSIEKMKSTFSNNERNNYCVDAYEISFQSTNLTDQCHSIRFILIIII